MKENLLKEISPSRTPLVRVDGMAIKFFLSYIPLNAQYSRGAITKARKKKGSKIWYLSLGQGNLDRRGLVQRQIPSGEERDPFLLATHDIDRQLRSATVGVNHYSPIKLIKLGRYCFCNQNNSLNIIGEKLRPQAIRRASSSSSSHLVSLFFPSYSTSSRNRDDMDSPSSSSAPFNLRETTAATSPAECSELSK